MTVQVYLNEINLLQELSESENVVKLYEAEVDQKKGYIHMVTLSLCLNLLEYGESDLSMILKKLPFKSVDQVDENFIQLQVFFPFFLFFFFSKKKKNAQLNNIY